MIGASALWQFLRLHGNPLRRERPPIDCLAHLRDLNIAQRVGVEYGISDGPPHISLRGPSCESLVITGASRCWVISRAAADRPDARDITRDDKCSAVQNGIEGVARPRMRRRRPGIEPTSAG